MKHKRFTLFVLALSLLFIFSGCRAASEAGEAPAEVAVPAKPTMEVANPAAVYCEEQGFAYEIRTNDDGSQFGVCILADGTECDEWAFFNGDCPAITPAAPAEVVQAFYNWYLDFMSDRSSGDFINPPVGGLYRDSEYLSADFIAQVDADLANMGELGGADPILLAQDIPVRVEVQEANVSAGEATVVLLRYWGGNPEPSPMVVHLRQENGRWLISSVSMAEPLPDSAPVGGEQYIFIDRDFGFSFNYPAGWVIEKLDMDGHGQPYDWPVAAGWMIMPPDVADTLAVQRPADPNVPIIVAPFNVEVVLGNEAAVTRVYMELEGETVEFNGVSGVKIGSDYKNYVFAHPYRYETWVVITDWVTEFPGREAQAESLTDVLLPLLNSLTFNETD